MIVGVGMWVDGMGNIAFGIAFGIAVFFFRNIFFLYIVIFKFLLINTYNYNPCID